MKNILIFKLIIIINFLKNFYSNNNFKKKVIKIKLLDNNFNISNIKNLISNKFFFKNNQKILIN